MPTLNLSRVVSNPRFAQNFTITRTPGSWVAGVWTPGTPQQVPFYGIIKPATPDELEMVPEGDRVSASITLHSVQQMFLTHTTGPTDPSQGTSDTLTWHGQQWRLMHLWEWSDFGYFKAIAVRMGGE